MPAAWALVTRSDRAGRGGPGLRELITASVEGRGAERKRPRARGRVKKRTFPNGDTPGRAASDVTASPRGQVNCRARGTTQTSASSTHGTKPYYKRWEKPTIARPAPVPSRCVAARPTTLLTGRESVSRQTAPRSRGEGRCGQLPTRSWPMPPCDDPALLTPEERLRELAAVLAAGVLRLRERAALPANSPQEQSQK